VFAGGEIAPTTLNTIDYITIHQQGMHQDFGDLTDKLFGQVFQMQLVEYLLVDMVVLVHTPRHNTIQFYYYRNNRKCTRFWRFNSFKSGTAKAGCSSPTRGILQVDISQESNVMDYM
jgi:hypothetical protein